MTVQVGARTPPLLVMPSLFRAQIWDAHVLCFMLPDLVGLFEGEVAGLPDRILLSVGSPSLMFFLFPNNLVHPRFCCYVRHYLLLQSQ